MKREDIIKKLESVGLCEYVEHGELIDITEYKYEYYIKIDGLFVLQKDDKEGIKS